MSIRYRYVQFFYNYTLLLQQFKTPITGHQRLYNETVSSKIIIIIIEARPWLCATYVAGAP